MNILLVESFVEKIENSQGQVKIQPYKSWLQGKLFNVNLLKKYDIKFDNNRYYEDTAFVEKCRVCIQQREGSYVELPIVTVVITEDNRNSVTRANDGSNKLKDYYWKYVGYTKFVIDVVTWKHNHYFDDDSYEVRMLSAGFRHLYSELEKATTKVLRQIIYGCIKKLESAWSKLLGSWQFPDSFYDMYQLLSPELRLLMQEFGLGYGEQEDNHRDTCF